MPQDSPSHLPIYLSFVTYLPNFLIILYCIVPSVPTSYLPALPLTSRPYLLPSGPTSYLNGPTSYLGNSLSFRTFTFPLSYLSFGYCCTGTHASPQKSLSVLFFSFFCYSALNIFCTNCGALQNKVNEKFSNTFLPAFKEVLRIAGEQVNCVNKDIKGAFLWGDLGQDQ